MSVRSIAAVPAVAPQPDASGPGRDLQDEARGVFQASAGHSARVLLAAGPSSVIHDRAAVGTPEGDAVVEVPVDTELLAALATRSGFPRGRTDRLEGALADLVRWSAHVDPGLPVLPVEIPAQASVDTLAAVATGVRGATEATDRLVGVVAVGDLARHTPETATRAQDFDREVVEALRRSDVAALGTLGPGPAHDLEAHGWAPLMVAALLAEQAGLGYGAVHYLARGGGGHVVLCP
jgi:hypothetical protein